MSESAIVHEDLLSFLASELPHTETELRDMLKADPDSVERIAEELARVPDATLEFTLAEPLADREETAPLVARGIRLSPRVVRSLLTRQLRNLDAPIGPLAIAAAEAVVNHYRRKISRHLEALVQRVRGAETGSSETIYKMIERSQGLAELEACFAGVVDRLLASPQNLSTLLPLVARRESTAVLARGIHTAFVAMAVLATHTRGAGTEPGRQALLDIGMAALLEDLGLGADTRAAEHPERSATIAERLGASPTVVGLILDHHRLGTPEEPQSPGLMAVLVATNVFVGKTCERSGQIFEAVKVLNHLAEGGLLNREVVRTLATLFLPRVKSFAIEQANRLGSQCPVPGNAPILWPVTGDKVPVVFLCRDPQCNYRASQVSRLAQEVPFQLDGVTLATIRKGDYFTCPPLTAKLKQLYSMIEGEGGGRRSGG